MNKIIIISTYISGKHQERVIDNCISSLLPLDIDILLIAHSPVPEYIQKKVKFFIYDSNNEFYDYPDRSMAWASINGIKYVKHLGDHTYALLRNIRNAFNFAKYMGYDFYHYVEGDASFNEVSRRNFIKFEEDLISSSKLIGFMKKADDFPHVEYIDPFIFSGYIDYFLEQFPFPLSKDEYKVFRHWDHCGPFFENNLYFLFHEKCYYHELTCDEFFDGANKYNLSLANPFIGVFYNTQKPNNPALLLYNDLNGYELNFKVYQNDSIIEDVNVGSYRYYLRELDDINNDYEIKIVSLINGEDFKHYIQRINPEEIEKLKYFYFIDYDNKTVYY